MKVNCRNDLHAVLAVAEVSQTPSYLHQSFDQGSSKVFQKTKQFSKWQCAVACRFRVQSSDRRKQTNDSFTGVWNKDKRKFAGHGSRLDDGESVHVVEWISSILRDKGRILPHDDRVGIFGSFILFSQNLYSTEKLRNYCSLISIISPCHETVKISCETRRFALFRTLTLPPPSSHLLSSSIARSHHSSRHSVEPSREEEMQRKRAIGRETLTCERSVAKNLKRYSPFTNSLWIILTCYLSLLRVDDWSLSEHENITPET